MGLRGIGSAGVALGAFFVAQTANAAGQPVLASCYERVYDAAHLSKHKKQLVVRATLSIKAAPSEAQADKANPNTATGDLKLWVRGRKQSFDSFGACEPKDGILLCNGSLSAAETGKCKTKADGVRNCRIDSAQSGGFQIEAKPDGVLVTIHPRLELVPAPFDGGTFLSLSETNPENHAFSLKATAAPCP